MNATDADSAPHWYQGHPERLAWELKCFEYRGLVVSTRTGRANGTYPECLVAETDLRLAGQVVPIEVVFPFEYPDEAPTYFAPPGLLNRHQHPSSGNLCWAEDQDRDWSPGLDAARIVAEEIRWLFEDAAEGIDEVRRNEADIPEPITGHILYTADLPIIVPAPYFAEELEASEGGMTIRTHRGDRHTLRAAAHLGAADVAALDRIFDGGVRDEPGHWLALDPTPTADTFNERYLVPMVDTAAPRAFGRLRRELKKKKRDSAAASWLGLTFLEEGPQRGQHRRNWVFARMILHRDGTKRIDQLARSQALTSQERQRRIPELAGLDESRVLVAGAGSVGGALTLELARAGVGHIDLVDPDTVDVNNSVRHILGPEWAGFPKADLVKLSAERLNPFVTVAENSFRVGDGPEAAAKLRSLIATVDVVVDTTGSNSVARILQRYVSSARKTLVVAGLSAGSFGGEIAIFRPGGPCVECLLLHQRDKTVPEPDRAPPQPGVTPIGCAHPAFSGAGFDATQLAATAARTVVQATGATDYPDANFDWAVINFRAAPRWRSGPLPKHSSCPRCH